MKSGWKTSEGQIAVGVVGAGIAGLYFLLTNQQPPMADAEVLMQYATTVDQVSMVLEMAAEQAKGNEVDWNSLAMPGGLLGMICYAFQYYTKARTKLKAADLVITNKDEATNIQF